MNRVKFDPNNIVIWHCMSGMSLESDGDMEAANAKFHQAWEEASDDFERFVAAYHVARQQKSVTDKLKWLEASLHSARNINDDTVRSAYATLYFSIAACYEELSEPDQAKRNHELSESYRGAPTDAGPFYHGTKADLQVGDLLTAGEASNYEPGLKMSHIYFTGNANGAGLAAALAKGEGRERVYLVEPTGAFENDPNVTDKKFPGNLTRSYRSLQPLKIVGEITEWSKLTTAERSEWREKLANTKGEIIN